MQRTFTINNKRYTAKPFDFNLICDLEDAGVQLAEISDKPMSAVRAYFTICSGLDKEEAGLEMQAHLIGGGKMDDVIEAMNAEMKESDFFRAITKSEDEETPKRKGQKTTEKE